MLVFVSKANWLLTQTLYLTKEGMLWKLALSVLAVWYKKVLGGLTLLDTLQSHTGMPKVIDHVESLQCKSVLSFMCMMETIHAKSYSTIFTTVASTPEINEIFLWVKKKWAFAI